jgi:calcium/calmodulin-dependent protein kinase I
VYEDPEKIHIVLELMGGENLLDYMVRVRNCDVETVSTIAGQIFEIIDDLHHNGIVHRDLKLENVMILEDGPNISVKLVDFGL